ncbi:MAG: hypothetical protein DRR08_12775 [Candidatus Parabeggiatoa sp. nov. 2]|nr:MAG: hypothetical protein B6247_05505 [Beggiatoa sp. 4572_84]RKZ59879.1 MAG: hypothetical protein DRR08_12775 [Gammaproteobacteria bacterium]HEC85424.1 hypothetical protein [Thioploca sp.]
MGAGAGALELAGALALAGASSFIFFPLTSIEQAPIWGIVLAFSFGIGIIAGFFGDSSSDGLWTVKTNYNVDLKTTSQTTFLWILSGVFFVIFLAIKLVSQVLSDDLNQKLNILAYFILLAPIVWTGLLLYPFVALIALWQFRHSQVQTFTPEKLHLTAPFRWQSFAYPLPGLRRYLFQLAQQHDVVTALMVIQQVQLWTLQMAASRKAAQDLASHPETAIAFCGEMAIQTNNATLLPVSLTGNVGRAVVVLAKPQYEENEQPLALWVDDFPPPTPLLGRLPFFTTQKQKQLKDFKKNRQSSLSERLEYALQVLQPCQDYQDIIAYQTLLSTWLQYAKIKHLGDILSIAERSVSVPPEYPQWMQGGWTILQDITNQITELKNYRRLESAEARRQYLTRLQKKLSALEWKNLPNYWANIGKELVTDWTTVLDKAKKQARNYLRLEIDLPKNSLLLGKQPLNLRVHNPTSLVAEHLLIQMQETEGLFWCHDSTKHPILEGGTHTDLHLECQILTPGRYTIRGQLTAQDLDGNPFQQPFDFQITAAEAAAFIKSPIINPTW